MNDKKMLRRGLIGSAVAAICCFTPVLVVGAAALGLSAIIGWLDFVLFPLLFASLGVVAQALWVRAGEPGPRPGPVIVVLVAAFSAALIWLEFRFALRITVAAVLFGWLIPAFVGAILGGARNLDAHLREQDALMEAVCAEPSLPRDEALCACVIAVEVPSLDCQDRFRPWLVARAQDWCQNPALSAQATSFCACAETVGQDLAAATADKSARAELLRAVPRCLALPDAPALASFQPAPSP